MKKNNHEITPRVQLMIVYQISKFITLKICKDQPQIKWDNINSVLISSNSEMIENTISW